jgi:DNA-binding IclR family transcriptional regulator
MRPKKRANAPRTVQSVDRAVGILEALAGEPDGLGLGGVAEAVGIRPQTAQSLLRTLQAHEFVVQAARAEPYRLGPAVHRLAARWLEPQHRAALARPAVKELAERLGEYALLAELRGSVLVGLVEVQARRRLMVTGGVEFGARMHTMATAQVILAHLPRERLDGILASLELTRTGPNTITSRREFVARLAEVRRHGYATCIGEAGPGIAAMAVPVREPSGEVNCALGVALPEARFSPRGERSLRRALLEAAKTVQNAWHGRQN